ncbi:polycystic kidney disease protein 1-like [Homalodisca vitripennis]|nr:polycystic kidney disease protein 1-like [Homalodisca vitripennis]
MGWVEDAAHRQIGVPQLRQLRVRPENCTTSQMFNLSGIVCLSAFNDKTEDKSNYGLNWGPVSKFVNKPELVPWSYTIEVEKESPMYGKSGKSYHSGGYIMRLANTQKESNRIISDLIDTGWLDIRMRAFIMELSLYNTNTDTYSLISVIIEHLPSGAFTSRVQGVMSGSVDDPELLACVPWHVPRRGGRASRLLYVERDVSSAYIID